MTRTTIRTLVRILLGETDSTNSYYTDTNINLALDAAINQLSMEIPESLTFSDITTVSGTYRYSLPTDYMIHSHIRLIVDSSYSLRLEQVDIHEFDAIYDSAYDRTEQPIHYKIEHGVGDEEATDPQVPGDIWIGPRPDSNGGANYTLRHYYFQRGFASSDSTVPAMTDLFHHAIAYYAAMFMSMKDGNQRKTQNFMFQYNNTISKGKKWLNKRDGLRALLPKDVGYAHAARGRGK